MPIDFSLRDFDLRSFFPLKRKRNSPLELKVVPVCSLELFSSLTLILHPTCIGVMSLRRNFQELLTMVRKSVNIGRHVGKLSNLRMRNFLTVRGEAWN